MSVHRYQLLAINWTPTENASDLLEDEGLEVVMEGEEEEGQVECAEQEHKGDGCAPRAHKHQEGENEPGKH